MSSQSTPESDRLESQQVTLFDRIFRDREGKIVIAQPPNLPMLVGIAATLLRFALPDGQIQAVLSLVGFGAWFTWAWEELFDGVNYFRRALGFLGLAGIIALALNLNGV